MAEEERRFIEERVALDVLKAEAGDWKKQLQVALVREVDLMAQVE